MVRLYELAKELKLTSRQLLSFFKSKNEKVGSNLSALTDKQEKLARTKFAARLEPAAPPKPKPEPKKPKPSAVIIGKQEIPVIHIPDRKSLKEAEELEEKVRLEREKEEEKRWRIRRKLREDLKSSIKATTRDGAAKTA
ncbi:MAG: hypothetical protein ABIH42_09075, partial [Planctomycetota bacterium]